MPHPGRFLREGTRAELRSVLLPFTPQAPTPFLTGVNPGRHGIFGFTEKSANDYSFQLVNARRLRSKTLAQMLGDAGKKVILLNVPMELSAAGRERDRRRRHGLPGHQLETPPIHPKSRTRSSGSPKTT